MNQGKIDLVFDGILETDYENRWEGKPLFFFLRTLFDKYIFKPYTTGYQSNCVDDVNNFQRESEFYFSFDSDLERVRWKKKWMRRTAKVLSFIKIPGPTFEIRDNGKMKLHGLFF